MKILFAVMDSMGKVIRIVRHDDLGTHASDYTVRRAVLALTRASPFAPWTDGMIGRLGHEQTMTVEFFVP